MKKPIVLASMVLLSLPALAAPTYRFPVERIKEFTPEIDEKLSTDEKQKMDRVSTFPLDILEVKTGEQGTIKYQLPTVLTGKKVVITMDKVADDDGVRVYQAADGTGASTCKGPETNPSCSIEVENLNLKDPQNIQLRNKNIAAVYSTADQKRVQLMADLFSDQIPIGIIRADLRKALPGLAWRGSYLVNGTSIQHDLCFYSSNNQLLGQYRVGASNSSVPCGKCPSSSSLCGTIEPTSIEGYVFKGQWRTGSSKGSVTFNFDDDLNFKGSYTTENSKQAGAWSGTRK